MISFYKTSNFPSRSLTPNIERTKSRNKENQSHMNCCFQKFVLQNYRLPFTTWLINPGFGYISDQICNNVSTKKKAWYNVVDKSLLVLQHHGHRNFPPQKLLTFKVTPRIWWCGQWWMRWQVPNCLLRYHCPLLDRTRSFHENRLDFPDSLGRKKLLKLFLFVQTQG